jgi:hypothetical protein
MLPDMPEEKELLGTWKLIGLTRMLVATGEEVPDHPRQGFMTFAPGGRMMTILVWADRAAPAGEAPTDRERSSQIRMAASSSPRFGGLNHACLGVRNCELPVRDRPDSGHAEICQKRRE